ncbi:MAG TPA: SurA N-terminal domain-containing protein [Vicinamibacterales bacterium]|nr:SurA N-terminal domain-containing protein [Vicinamibacterales bacterium]
MFALIPAACRSTPPPPPAAAAVSASTWAVVNGHEITREDVDRAYRRSSQASQPVSDEEAMTAKLSILNDLIVQDILVAKARDLKLEIAPAELDKAYSDTRKNLSDDAFQQELTKRNLSADDIREGLRRELLTQKVMEHEVTSKVTIADQEVADFFNANKAAFNMAEDSYRVAQIVVTPVRDAQLANRTGDDAATPQAAMAKTQMLMERLKSGTPFGELAMDYSEDPQSAPRGGDLGYVPVSTLKNAPAALRDAVLNKTPGSVNVVSSGGSHTIVLVVGFEKAGQRDLSMPQVRDGITSTLRGRREQLLRAAYLSALRNDAKVVNYLARRVVDSQGKALK